LKTKVDITFNKGIGNGSTAETCSTLVLKVACGGIILLTRNLKLGTF